MSPINNFPSTEPLTLLVGYKFPTIFVVFGVEPDLPLTSSTPLQQSWIKSSLPFNKYQNKIFFNTVL